MSRQPGCHLAFVADLIEDGGVPRNGGSGAYYDARARLMNCAELSDHVQQVINVDFGTTARVLGQIR